MKEAPSARSMQEPPRSSAPSRRGVSVTLLDGTTISLPGSRVPAAPKEPEASARDVVAALRAAARGADVREVLGENPRWEQMFAALLAILLRKGLLTDREFLDELEKG
jgi:hypothetical protein